MTLAGAFPERLEKLELTYMRFTSLPRLPGTLRHADLGYAELVEFPQLPDGLRVLNLRGNPFRVPDDVAVLPDSIEDLGWAETDSSVRLDRLPQNLKVLWWSAPVAPPALPSGLRRLSVGGGLTTLPHLPESLEQLNVTGERLVKLPELPDGIVAIDVIRTGLDSLPSLPRQLRHLRCWHNPLTTLPTLPAALTRLSCEDNRLLTLPPLPDALETLNCARNQLAALPELPVCLHTLDCGSNALTELPDLMAWWHQPTVQAEVADPLTPINLAQGLRPLICHHNRLTALPELPRGLSVLRCNNNQLTALSSALPLLLEYLNCPANDLETIVNLPLKIRELYCRDNPRLRSITVWQDFDLDKIYKFSAANTVLTELPERLQHFSR